MKWTNPLLHLAAVLTLLILTFQSPAVAQQGSMQGSMGGSMEMKSMGEQQVPADLDTSTSKDSGMGFSKGVTPSKETQSS